MRFSNLKIEGWRQFSDVDISFHPRLTIVAGSNGAGKSTMLRLLSQHFGFSNSLLATPTFSKSGVLEYFHGLFGWGDRARQPDQRIVGMLSYSNGERTDIVVPTGNSITYSVSLPRTQPVQGLFINSHRPISGYQAIASIPANAIGVEQAYQMYSQEIQNKYNNSYTQFSPTYRIKEAIVSMATFGPGNRNVQRNAELESTYDDFKVMLSKVLPESIGFIDISIRIPDVVLVTSTGEFVIDASSGGLMALIDIAWQMFLYSRGKDEFVAVIDEPENHLHPSMQRSIIGNLLSAFPNAQIIVATHSPFVVSSVQDSFVYVLRYRESEGRHNVREVFSEKLDNVNKAGSASDILRSVLGVPVTLPIWAEDTIERIAAEFNLENLDRESIAKLRSRLEAAGLGEFYADALSKLASRR